MNPVQFHLVDVRAGRQLASEAICGCQLYDPHVVAVTRDNRAEVTSGMCPKCLDAKLRSVSSPDVLYREVVESKQARA